MDTITIFEDTLKTVTVVHADKELIFKVIYFFMKYYYSNQINVS